MDQSLYWGTLYLSSCQWKINIIIKGFKRTMTGMPPIRPTFCNPSLGPEILARKESKRARVNWAQNLKRSKGNKSCPIRWWYSFEWESLFSSSLQFQKQSNYCEVSGSKTNTRKIQIFRWNVSPREMSALTRILDFPGKVQWHSFKYLGFPIFKKNPRSNDWLTILEKLKAPIQSWGTRWLKLDGNLVIYSC